jgi:hypothetical protein
LLIPVTGFVAVTRTAKGKASSGITKLGFRERVGGEKHKEESVRIIT